MAAQRFAAWIERHSGAVIAAMLTLSAAMALPLLLMPPGSTASQEPSGLLFEARQRAQDRFATRAHRMVFIVEAVRGELLRREPLNELLTNANALRRDAHVGPLLLEASPPGSGGETMGLMTIADAVDAMLRSAGSGGIASVSEDQVTEAVTRLLAASGPGAFGLSTRTRQDPSGQRWRSPMALVEVRADNTALGGGGSEAALGARSTRKEAFARQVQQLLRGEQRHIRVWGLAIDVNLTSIEQGRSAGPFIGLAIFIILLLSGLFFRSYWVVAVVGLCLGCLMLWIKGLNNLVGLKHDQILSVIVPIAMISFGVDFTFHALGRYREEQRRTGARPGPALVASLGGVLGALLLAMATDSAAFLSNVTSGIESLIQFGVAAALATVASFILLGMLAPLLLMRLGARVGPAPRTRAWNLLGAGGSVLAALGAMASVILLVYVLPWAGVVSLAGYALLFVLMPSLLIRHSPAVPAEATQTGGQLQWIGRLVLALARQRRWLLPVFLVFSGICAYLAQKVEAQFDVKDFFSPRSDFVVALDRFDHHMGQASGEPALIYIEGDLARPGAVTALQQAAAEIRELKSDRLARDPRGKVQLGTGLLEIVQRLQDRQAVVTSEPRLRSALGRAREAGVAELSADRVRSLLWQQQSGRLQATHFDLRLPGSRAHTNIEEVRRLLQPILDRLQKRLRAEDPAAQVVLTGQPIARQAALDAIIRAFRISLPVAVVLCFLLAALFLRSLRLATVSIAPILLVVTWLYAFMYLAGYGLNVVTATIGAISIGVGIDFAVHVTMRFSEELRGGSAREQALAAAGAGTGGALIGAALSSIVGFSILVMAPMPMFSSFGLLTAVMILLAAVASLLVLPSLLMLVTPGDT